MRKIIWRVGVVAALVLACLSLFVIYMETRTRSSWDPKAAAADLDRREKYWATWDESSRDRGTFCISCHTAMPYAFARPALRTTLGEPAPSHEERALIENVEKRVRLWKEVQPYYSSMPVQSRGTEAVLNALILAVRDSQSGGHTLSPDTREALQYMWAEQQADGPQKGGWRWILFDNEPWEAVDSPYYGACLAAVATGIAPGNYSSDPAIQANVATLRDYLRRESAKQMPINRVNLLWASAQLPGLLSAAEQQAIVAEILAKQRSDGGWSLASLIGDWQREDGTPQVEKSDGYATGFIVMVLQQLGMSRDDVHVKQGLAWLVQNQNPFTGAWSGYSLNKRRHNPFSNVSQFMDDAATAYAVLALTESPSPMKGQSNQRHAVPGRQTLTSRTESPSNHFRRSASSSSSVRGQSAPSRRDSPRSASTRPPVWQRAQ
jgi:squalene-hopene/tetraprenyl-beta-curcumene cyclase